jgi:Terminase RNaseH-like domain
MRLETLSPELQKYEPLLARMKQQMETELVRRGSENRIDSYYPDEGPLRRELYPRHLELFRAGVEHRERCFLAANRVGKTEGVGGYDWPRCYALDVGWNRTAAIWGAWNLDEDKVFLYAEHYRSQAEPAIHAAAIRARGAWIPGVIDPAARGRSQVDGTRLIEQYSDLGLLLAPAENAVEAGLYAVWERLSDGRLFVFNSLQNWLSEFRIYRRDEKGKIVKQNDHLMDATRYLILSGLQVACREPREEDDDNRQWIDSTRNEYTGY